MRITHHNHLATRALKAAALPIARGERAFSLIEVMVSLGITGIVMTLIMTMMLSSSRAAKATEVAEAVESAKYVVRGKLHCAETFTSSPTPDCSGGWDYLALRDKNGDILVASYTDDASATKIGNIGLRADCQTDAAGVGQLRVEYIVFKNGTHEPASKPEGGGLYTWRNLFGSGYEVPLPCNFGEEI